MASSTVKELYGLIGYPVKHSFSAAMHEAAFVHCGIDAEYRLFEVDPSELEHFFKRTVKQEGLKGFNVTIPHKERACDFLTGSMSHRVRMNRAVNTVRVEKDGALSGFNTDGPGFCRDLREHGLDITDQTVVLLGAGGAAKAVATTLAALRPSQIVLYDIDAAKQEGLAAILKEFYPRQAVTLARGVSELALSGAALLINATPVGMKPADPLIVNKEDLHPGLFVYDLIYNPPETRLLAAARQAGCRIANGSGMLLYQGCLAFEHWTGKTAPVEVMRQALSHQLGEVRP